MLAPVIFAGIFLWHGQSLGADIEAIKRQALSKTPVAKILKTKSRSGHYDIDVVRAVIEAGVEPYVTVYLAIVEGYPASEVIKAAIEEGLIVEKVLLAAISAGTSEISAARSVTAMGVSPENAADAIARITVPVKILP